LIILRKGLDKGASVVALLVAIYIYIYRIKYLQLFNLKTRGIVESLALLSNIVIDTSITVALEAEPLRRSLAP
jgi:hypothetical protein